MKKTLRLMALMLCTPVFSFAQVPIIEWSHTYGGSHGEAFGDVTTSPANDLFIVSTSSSMDGDFSANHYPLLNGICIKANSSGDTSWIRFFGGSGGDVLYKGINTLDGGFLAVGQTTSVDGDITFNNGLGDLWVTKLDSLGNLQWQKTYGGSGYDEGRGVMQLKDSDYIILGSTESNDGDIQSNHGGEDIWIVRIDRVGNLIWEKTYGGSLFDRANHIIQTPDNGFAFTGLTSSNDGDVSGHHAFMTNPNNMDIWLVKIDSAGTIQWQKCFGGKDTELPGDLKNTLDGGFIVAGFTRSKHSGNVKENFGGADFWVVKTDSNGKLRWQRNYGGTKDDEANGIIVLPGGGYIIGGTVFSSDEQVTGSHGGIGDGWIIRISNRGKLLGSLAIGGSDYDGIFSLCKTKNATIVGAGFSYSSDGDLTENKGFYDGWLIKIGPAALKQMEEGANLSASIETATQVAASVFPNPSADHFELKVNELPLKVIVMDITGKEMEVMHPQSSAITFGERYRPGIYLACITWADGKTQVLKMVKQ